jgi:hypothetical protein
MSQAEVAADRLAIMECLSRYSWAYDTHDPAMLRGVFAEDASLSMFLQGSRGWGPYLGRDTIVEWMSGFMRPQTDQRRHSMTNFIFDQLTATQALVRCFLVLTSAEHGHARFVTTGMYRVELSKTEDMWSIAKLELFLDAPF